MTELTPTPEHLQDPYVLQLIEALAKRDDEIERLRAKSDRDDRYIMHLLGECPSDCKSCGE